MRQQFYKILISVIIFSILSCQGQEKNSNKNNSEKKEEDKMELTLKKQIGSGESGEYNNSFDVKTYDYSEVDLEVIIPTLENILKSNGYKPLDNVAFNKKIETIFGRIINPDSQNKFLFLNFQDKCNRELRYHTNDFSIEINPFGLYIIKNKNFITELYPISELIDYQKEYPEILKYENSLNINQTKNGNPIKLYLWKNATDLKERRQKHIKTIVARNMYLFNDSRAHFRWLILNDEFFMENLVTVFGYNEDKELLKWVIEKNLPKTYNGSPEQKILDILSKLLWTKKCDGNIVVNKNILNVIDELSTPDKTEYILFIAEYIHGGLCIGCDKDAVKNDLSFKDKSKILAHLLEFGEKYKFDKRYNFNQMFLGNFYHYLDYKKEYIKEFERNNFYGLSNLKQWYLSASKEENIFKNIVLDDIPQPRDYLYRS